MDSLGTKIALYVEKLKSLEDWDSFLMQESGLPGPRGNLELAQAFAEIANEQTIKRYIALKPDQAPNNAPEGFLAFCGVIGLGTLISKGKHNYLKQLRQFASDSRWRIRESVAMALQIVGDSDIDFLLCEMKEWSRGNLFEKRATIAALCEPRLLTSEKVADIVLDILNEVTSSIIDLKNIENEGFDVLKKGLAYCWSVAVVAYPEKGKKLIEKWARSKDKTIRLIIRENLKKNRLLKMDKEWVSNQTARLNKQP